MTERQLRYISFGILGLLAAIGIFLILRATPEGLGLSDDSIAYIAGARSILAGHGYREAWLASNGPVTHFPPGFSFALAVVGWFGLDPLRGARLVNSLLFGSNAVLLGILGWRMTKSLPAGLVLAALFVVNDSMLQVHAVAMSEPLFIFLSLLSFWAFDLYFERDTHWLWLITCGVLVGWAYLTRYSGLALVATFIVALVVLRDTWRKRLIGVGIFLIGALPWMIGWGIRNELVAGNATNREFLFHPITAENFDTALYNVSTFLMPVDIWRRNLIKIPGFFQGAVVLILGAVLLWILIRGWKRFMSPKETPRPEVISFISALYIFGYLASIFASMSFFDASTKFKLRILAPVYISLLILLAALGVWLWSRRREAVIVLGLVIFGLMVYGQYSAVTQLMKGGQGYASFQWYDSKAMAFLRKLPSDMMIYTNQPAAVYLYTGRGAYVLPNRYDPVTAQKRPGFDRGVTRLQADVNDGSAVLALFDAGNDPNMAAMSHGLYVGFKGEGDAVYTAAP